MRLWHSEDRASRYILIIQPRRCTISQLPVGIELYMFQTDLLSIIRSLNTVFSAICHTEILKMGKITSVCVCVCVCVYIYNTEFYPQHVLQFSYNVHVYTLVILPIFKISVWQIPTAENTVLKLLMMDSKSVRNM